MSCYDQGAVEVGAVNFTQSLQYTFAPASLIATISLSSRVDFGDRADASAEFTAVKYSDGLDQPLPHPADGPFFNVYPSHIRDNDLIEIRGRLIAFRCRAKAVVNFFAWPRL